ncbi:hypothetical protein PFISCL1PPCAC_4026, partial [Pristionchus fissidentatus]
VGLYEDMVRAVSFERAVRSEDSRREAAILATVETIKLLRQFHHEHVTCERLLVHGMYEASTTYPRLVVGFAYDGMRKNKTMLPSLVTQGKDDRKMVQCLTYSVQRAVKNDYQKPTPAEKKAEKHRRQALADLRTQLDKQK